MFGIILLKIVAILNHNKSIKTDNLFERTVAPERIKIKQVMYSFFKNMFSKVKPNNIVRTVKYEFELFFIKKECK